MVDGPVGVEYDSLILEIGDSFDGDQAEFTFATGQATWLGEDVSSSGR